MVGDKKKDSSNHRERKNMSESKAPDCAVEKVGNKEGTLRCIKRVDLITIGLSIVALFYLYAPTFKSWYIAWTKEESYYSHAFLVPIISGFIIWLKRKDLAETVVRPSPIGYLIVIPSLLFALVGMWSGATAPQSMVFPLIIFGSVISLLGLQIARKLVFPIGYLYFMCVLPEFIIEALSFRIQVLSTIGATAMMRLIGLDVVRSGVNITVPNLIDVVQVGQPCSGFRLLISLLALCILIIYLVDGPKWGKAILLLFTLPLSVLLNSIRVAMIALVGNYMGVEAMLGFHDWSGYIMLVLAMISLFLLARLVKCREFSSILSS